jgi:hypothetical protein
LYECQKGYELNQLLICGSKHILGKLLKNFGKMAVIE